MPEPAFEPERDRERESSSVGVRTLPREPDSGVTIQRPAVVRPISASQHPKVHVVAPDGFNDAQEIGDKFREGTSVIMNLQATEAKLARRLVDFASGLAYGLRGSMQPVAENVFLLTPAGVQVSAEERRRFLE